MLYAQTVRALTWRTHFACRVETFSTLGFELELPTSTCRDESRHGTHECVRYVGVRNLFFDYFDGGHHRVVGDGDEGEIDLALWRGYDMMEDFDERPVGPAASFLENVEILQ